VSSEETRTIIRPATPRDVPRLIELFGELAAYEQLSDKLQASEQGLH
jgi:hypothetical protein